MTVTEAKIIAPVAPLRGRPDASAELATELLFGERVAVGFARDDWAEVTNRTDGYRGFVPADALAPDSPEQQPTHRVIALRSFVYAEPNMKTQPLTSISFWSAVMVTGERNGFYEIENEGWIWARHVADLEWRSPDPVDTARRFLGIPYLWGGRSSLGIDCSGLLQLSLAAVGIAAPRDSGPQSQKLGHRVIGDVRPRRSDMLFWPGHVGLVTEENRMIHANAFHMCVTEESIGEVVERYGALPEVRRL